MVLLDNPTQEELFDLWCEELIKAGYIESVLTTKELDAIVLFEGFKQKITIEKQLKTKIKTIIKEDTLLHPATYTPDRLVFWTPKAKDIFFRTLNSRNTSYFIGHYDELQLKYYSAIEVKAPPGYGGSHTSDAAFAVKQKWLWSLTNIYVNKVYLAPNKKVKTGDIYLWLSTFTPERYFYTDKATKPRTFSKWVPRTLAEFIEAKKP